MRRYILTGTPGSGKTAILRMLEVRGHCVVEEAATDVIALEAARGVAEPHADAGFVERILALQINRRNAAANGTDLQFHDRSPVCTLALARYLGRPVSPALAAELTRIRSGEIYEDHVFFIRNLGFCTPTEARRISFEECLKFERLHEEVYQSSGYTLETVDAGPLCERVEHIVAAVARWERPAADPAIKAPG